MPTSHFSSLTPTTPLWQVLYEDAVLEFDDAKLHKRILQAQSAIHDREREVPTEHAEHHRLENALQILGALEEISAGKESA